MNLLDSSFDQNVFINCPFDTQYRPLLRPLLFTVLHLRFNPRIASERFDSGEARINKISELIESSKYSIHDLSRMQAIQRDEIYRMNMPLELGIDIGCRLFKGGASKQKLCLILEKERFRYKRAISDLSNSDIKNHNDEPEDIVRAVRNWFVENNICSAPSATVIWGDFNVFMADFYETRAHEGYSDKDLEFMPETEFINFIKKWLGKKRGF